MPRGKGGRISGSVTTSFDVNYDFELFSVNDNGQVINPSTDTNNIGGVNITSYTFPGVIENFKGGYDINFEPGFGILEYDAVTVLTPLTLDLTARYLPAGTTITLLNNANVLDAFNGNGQIIADRDRIEYIFRAPTLEARGISEFALFVEDQEPGIPGFQLNGETIDSTSATNNLESIIDTLGLAGISEFTTSLKARVSAPSETNTAQILSVETNLAGSTISIEAEDLSLSTYLVEDFSTAGANAVNDVGISLLNASGTTGTASFVASSQNLSGTYNLNISYFDENDGAAQIQVLINNDVVGEILLNENTSSGIPTEGTRRQFTIENLNINSSDTITFRGIADGSEWARIDDISFSPDTSFLNPRSPIVLEAEDLNLSTYLVENFSTAGANAANVTGISLLNASGTTGTASFLASSQNLSGIYDLNISYFDENDGAARLEVIINNNVVDTITLNGNTSSGLPTEETRREFVLEDLLIRPEDTIAIRGIADGSEWARIDSLTFEVDTLINFDESTGI